jgi:hypothetical protein
VEKEGFTLSCEVGGWLCLKSAASWMMKCELDINKNCTWVEDASVYCKCCRTFLLRVNNTGKCYSNIRFIVLSFFRLPELSFTSWWYTSSAPVSTPDSKLIWSVNQLYRFSLFFEIDQVNFCLTTFNSLLAWLFLCFHVDHLHSNELESIVRNFSIAHVRKNLRLT